MGYRHDKVNSTKLLHTAIGCGLEAVELWVLVSVCKDRLAVAVTATMMVTYISHINPANADDLGSFADRRYLSSTCLGLLDIAP